MRLISARNAHAALPIVLDELLRWGVQRDTRNGPVLMFAEPTTIHYQRPQERVIFWKERDANPFFHLMEALWMLEGRNDVRIPAEFAKNIANYSDDGKILHGAYGHRWRYHFGRDQVADVIDALRENKDDRRQVIDIWDGTFDLGYKGKDAPCNLTATMQINNVGALDMVVFNRSNDIIWGALGANVVHFSMLQEYIAAYVGVPMGGYWQVSANMHAYLDTLEKCKSIAYAAPDPLRRTNMYNPYVGHVVPFPLFTNDEQDLWEKDLTGFFTSDNDMVTPFFRRVAEPMLRLHRAYKAQENPESLETLISFIRASDWRVAAQEWIWRRVVRPVPAGESLL